MRFRLAIVMFAVILTLSACGGGIKNALNWPIEDFTFTNQNGEDVGLEDLKGKIWVADFIFTNCTTTCPSLTFNMAKLQKMVDEEGLDNVEFISFSVDPEVDTPKALKEYASYFDLDLNSFQFLTGYSQEFIETFALENFKTLVKKPENEDQVIHQNYFYLVDQEGVIMQYYSGASDVPYADIVSDIKTLQ